MFSSSSSHKFVRQIWVVLLCLVSIGFIRSALGAEGTLPREVEVGLEVFRSDTGLLRTRLDDQSFLSETVGLEMRWRLLVDDREGFHEQVELLEAYFLSSVDLLFWKIDERMRPVERSNASIDDLRVCAALLDGYERWEIPEYRELALKIGRALRSHCTSANLLVDGTSWSKKGVPYGSFEYLTLSYADLQALRILAEYDASWKPIFKRTREVLRVGLDQGPPFWGYDLEKGRYDRQDDNLINLMLHLLYMARDGGLEQAYLGRMERYFLKKGHPVDTNIAALALWAGVLQEMGREAEGRKVLAQARRYRTDAGGNGAILGYSIHGDPGLAWVFDNLVYLIMSAQVQP